MKNIFKLLLCSALIVSGCQSMPAQPEAKDDNAAIVSSPTETKLKIQIDREYLVSPEGIGDAKLGMTLGELKQIVPENTQFEFKSPFMVDLNAIAVSQSGEVQYYILFFSDIENPSDSDRITYLMTQNPQYQTKEGIEVGSTIKEAEDIYGNAVLSYSINNESREYVEFRNFPSAERNIAFRANSALNNGFAGIYPQKVEEFNQTENYRDDGIVASIEVACRTKSCP